MKIAVLSNMYPDAQHPSYGVFVKNFCSLLDEMDVDYDRYTMRKADSVVGKIKGYFVFYFITTLLLLFKRYDLVYIHYASHSSQPVLWTYPLKKQRIFTNVHGSDVVPENAVQERMQKYTRRILAISEKVIVPSEYFKRLVCQKYGISEKLIFISPSGGVNEMVFYKEKEKTYSEILKLGYVGRISYKKGWDTLLKACSQLTIPYSLIVVGNGLEYKQMRLLAESLKIDEHVTWRDLLPQEQLRDVYNDIDAFVFPTEREGESLGLVALEAMACGTPVIASDYAAPAYYVTNGVNGLKFKCGDSNALAEAVIRFRLFTEDEKKEMGKMAIKTATEYNQETILKGMMDIFGK